MSGRRALGWVAKSIAVAVVLLALMVSLFRIVVPQVPAYRDDVAVWAGGLLGAPVDIDDMDLRWRRLRPELILGNLRYVSADARHAFAAREVRIGISLRALLQGEFAPARIVLVDPDITLDIEAVGGGDGAGWRRAFAAREHRGVVRVENGQLTLRFAEGRRRVDFNSVNAELSSDGTNHRLRVAGQPGDAAAGTLHAELSARGWPGQRSWQAIGRAGLRGGDLVALQRLGGRGRLQSGRVELDIGIDISGGTQRISVDLGLAALRWAGADGSTQRVDRAAAEIEWAHRTGAWNAQLQTLVVARGDGVRSSEPVTVAHNVAGGVERWQVTGGRLFLEDAALLAEALPWAGAAGIDDLLARNPRGRLESAALTLRRTDTLDDAPEPAPARYALTLQAVGLGLDSGAGRVPGFENLSLTVDATETGGYAAVAMEAGSVVFPRVFRGPLPVNTLAADLGWARAGEQWSLHAPRIELTNSDISAEGDGTLTWSSGEPPALDLTVGFSGARLSAHRPYLPVAVMSDALVRWLDRAVLGGVARAGTVRYSGELGAGALRSGRAVLDAAFDADEIRLAFAETWPVFEGGRAAVRISGTDLSASVSGGSLADVETQRAEVAIAAFAEPVLTVDAETAGSLMGMIHAFRATPPGDRRWLADVQAEGESQLALVATVPLRDTARTTVRGALVLDDATLRFGGFPHPLSGIRGTLSFAEDGVDARGIEAVLLDAPVSIEATSLRDGAGAARAVEVSLDGRADHDTLAAVLGYADPPVSGSTRWQARVFAPYDAGHEPYLQVESSLAGLAIALPAPLGKDAHTARPATVRVELVGDLRRFSVVGGDALSAVGAIAARDGRWRLARGRIQVGGGDVAEPTGEGVVLSGRIAAWRHGGGAGMPGIDAEVPFTEIDLQVDALEVYGRPLDGVRMQGQREAAAWRWSFDGSRVAGTLSVPDAPTNEQPIIAEFTRLALPLRADAATPAEAQPELDAAMVPPLSFHIREFRLGEAALGELNGVVRRVENGVVLEGFSASRADLRIAGDASWHTVDGFHRTTLRGTVDSTDVRRALDALGYGATIEAAAGHLQAEVDWLGSPLTDPRPLLNGAVSVRIERGTLFELQPGAGRVFGLLSLNALPRRLALDFSDVYRRGLAFDSIAGSFRIEGGQAHTDDLRLQGPAARVEVRGRTGLATRDYDQEAVVVASLASSLAIAGTLAGGPGVGAAVLLASELLRGPLEGISRARYRVTGPWEAPAVERVVEPVRGPQ
ncbi:MAG: YhdP family protein [Gammaproteobacteria bacterium]